MKDHMKTLIENKDYDGIRRLLSANPSLANEGIPFDEKNTAKAHPLHRICDAVFAKKITDEDAITIAKIFLEFGARIEGNQATENQDPPLMAAASLHAEQLGVFYIEHGANVHYADNNDGATALHWAAYCGRDELVARLISAGAAIDQQDKSYNSTPVGWALQPLITGDKFNTWRQAACIKLLLKAGANITVLNDKATRQLRLLAAEDEEFGKLLA